MGATDVTGTLDTTAVVGNTGPAPVGSASSATVKDTTPTGGGGGGDNNKPATQPDTAPAGASDGAKVGYAIPAMSGTLLTVDGGGSPIQHANPVYRKPADPGQTATTKDTSLTDKPISDGSTPSQASLAMTGVKDTVNQTVTLQTTTTNKPVAPAAPTVVAGKRKVTVTWAAVADPGGAAVRGYRIEGSTGGHTFAGRNATSVDVTNLVPSQSYKFRVIAVNDNGDSAPSAWSAAVTPLNPDEAGPGLATTIDADNRLNKVYNPDGTSDPGTGGTPGAVATVTVAATGVAGQFKVDWGNPAWGTPTGFKVKTSTGETQDVTNGATRTYTFAGLSNSVARSATVTPYNANGDGIAKTSAGTATPL